ncbi:hypothetical protein JNB62_00930 [Microbacterium jejuense]|uniref:Uncharacterized protein n=1 Tax=Microbacterium jejuense TaxID=1263637 RepID=A0ABS7HH52_9MICO|nr:hypothetical protein [Microbacterium jejuense]MBW9092241.1 hypothetical protein [Microbacterium jejuense]
MFAVYAAEQQYHHDSRTREHERLILASIRERSAAAPAHLDAFAPQPRTTVVAPRPERTAWPRPIGLHAHGEAAAGCAVA